MPFHLRLFIGITHSIVKLPRLNFRGITTIFFFGVQNFRIFIVFSDKIDIDSGEIDREKEEEKTNRIGDNDTVYADQVQQSPLMAKPGLLAGMYI